ncbi:MAG: DUF1475 family protein [Acidaminobacteraceae bacterium]
MKIAKIVTWIGLFAMTIGLLNGFINGNFINDGKILLDNPWGIMSMIDLYVGFTLFSLWIFYREKSIYMSIFWTLLMMILGFFTACVYILLALYSSKEDWQVLLMGESRIKDE